MLKDSPTLAQVAEKAVVDVEVFEDDLEANIPWKTMRMSDWSKNLHASFFLRMPVHNVQSSPLQIWSPHRVQLLCQFLIKRAFLNTLERLFELAYSTGAQNQDIVIFKCRVVHDPAQADFTS